MYHAYRKGFLGLGRQTLLEPIKITRDGWLKAPTGTGIEKPLRKPVPSPGSRDRLAHLNAFRIGLDWKFYKKFDPNRATVTSGVLTLQAQGKTPQELAPLLFVAGAHDYEISVQIEKDSGAVAGLALFYNADF